MALYELNVIVKNINFDLLEKMETTPDGVTLDEALLTIAIPCTRVNYAKISPLELKRAMKSIKIFLKLTKRSMETYTKEGVREVLAADWLSGLEYDEKIAMIIDEFKIIQEFDATGKAVFNQTLVNTYQNLRNKQYTKIEYASYRPAQKNTSSTPKKKIGEGPFREILVQNIDGYWCAETMISAEQWYQIIKDATPKMKTLIAYYLTMPGYRGSCLQIATKYRVHDRSINMTNTSLGERALKMMGNFSIQDPSNPEQSRYWSVAMNRGRAEAEGFVWELRPELAEAAMRLQKEGGMPNVEEGAKLMNEEFSEVTDWVISDSKKQEQLLQTWIELYKQYWDWTHREEWNNGKNPDFRLNSREGYKWASVEQFQKVFDFSAENFSQNLSEALKYEYNLLSGPHYYPKACLVADAREFPNEVKAALSRLFDENLLLSERIATFLETMKEIHSNYQRKIGQPENLSEQSVRSASVYLAHYQPNKYYIFKQSIVDKFIGRVGLKIPTLGSDVTLKLSKYERLCRWLREILIKDSQLVQLVNSTYSNDPSDFHLTTQDFIYFVSEHTETLGLV